MELKIDGITYESIIIEPSACHGCVAENNSHLCLSIADSCDEKGCNGIIWIKKGT